MVYRFISSRLSSSSCRVTPIDNEGVADDKTCASAAQPENGGSGFTIFRCAVPKQFQTPN
jgi:hypothetical protein